MAAFTTVSARRALSQAQPTPPTAAEANKAKPNVFPQAVREYVQRCFDSENAIAGISEKDMQIRLKQVINDAAENDQLLTLDWNSLPLPQQMLQAERKATLLAPAVVKSTHPTPSATTDKPPSKKRKSSELSRDVDSTHHNNNHNHNHKPDIVQDTALPPPWRKGTDFEDRLSFPDQQPQLPKKKQRRLNESAAFKEYSKSATNTDLERRRKRFGDRWRADETSSGPDSRADTPLPDVDDGPVIGTCQVLEKNYFRLTSAPKPETVRPLPVLEKALDLLKRKWRTDGNYSYICDQFKSLRQDLTVQHIRTSFTVNVYEIHARIALEKGDLGEYNQCQSQLRALYKQKLGGHPAEFLAYRILYMIYTCNRTDMNDVLADLTLADRGQLAVKHALEVRSALALGNYHRFFRLYLQTPHMGAYLMDMFIERERLAALANICRAYKHIDLRFLTEELGFESDRDTAAFICDHGGTELLENKENGASFASSKAGAIFESAKAAAFKRVDIKGQI